MNRVFLNQCLITFMGRPDFSDISRSCSSVGELFMSKYCRKTLSCSSLMRVRALFCCWAAFNCCCCCCISFCWVAKKFESGVGIGLGVAAVEGVGVPTIAAPGWLKAAAIIGSICGAIITGMRGGCKPIAAAAAKGIFMFIAFIFIPKGIPIPAKPILINNWLNWRWAAIWLAAAISACDTEGLLFAILFAIESGGVFDGPILAPAAICELSFKLVVIWSVEPSFSSSSAYFRSYSER